ncbi:unnamed protein product [Bursaphelenchus okinawaensis]|uniref:Uncharacterized protein n=1 Tax=Bursaphelenchus okinawaensis TaxID=465554 RepID=A0A811LAQ4_9BILA|nr:unnamed protein product [Bursaphelenchus okinawaensis]CAG9120078.1 unnamed protein product [Bursaphelenchus okinawaensis]
MSTLNRVSQKSWSSLAWGLLFWGGGIVLFYSVFSYLQEKITKGKYGEEKTQFTYMQSLVLVQCLLNSLVAYAKKSSVRNVDNVPLRMYCFCSISYSLAMLFSNVALEYINYPTQVLGKSCKPIPILVAGVLFAHKSYHWRKYMYILMIVLGMAIFLYKEKPGTHTKGYSFGWGEGLLGLSLVMDGVTGAVQDRIRHSYHTEKWNMMFYMNLISSVILGSSAIVTGEILEFISFIQSYPDVLFLVTAFAVCGALGQCCIFHTVTEYGPLTCSIVTNLRKLFTVVASIIIFQHPYTTKDAVGAGVVFLALFFDAWDSKRQHTKVVKE